MTVKPRHIPEHWTIDEETESFKMVKLGAEIVQKIQHLLSFLEKKFKLIQYFTLFHSTLPPDRAQRPAIEPLILGSKDPHTSNTNLICP